MLLCAIQSSLDDAKSYFWWYHAFVLFFTLIVLFNINNRSQTFNKWLGWLLALGAILFITFRPPVWQVFGDVNNYIQFFENSRLRSFDWEAKDLGFEWSMHFFNRWDYWIWFLFYAILYVVPQLFISQKLLPKHSAICFVMLVGCFNFFGYGFNGMRNGAACALVMLGMFDRRLLVKLLLFIVALSIHKSVIIPICAYILATRVDKTQLYFIIWAVCLLAALFISNLVNYLIDFSSFIEDDRVNYLTSTFDSLENNAGVLFSRKGFRWDFALVSSVPIILGFITVVKDKIRNERYSILLNTYILANTLWLFTARIPFNNRFAYLSWFLAPLLLTITMLINPRLRTSNNLLLLILVNAILTLLI